MSNIQKKLLSHAYFDALHDCLIARYDKKSPNKIKEGNLKVALQAFVQKPKTLLQKKIQALGVGVSGDFAILTKDSFNITIEMDNFDLGFQRAFRAVTLGRGQDSWEIYNVGNSLEFTKVQEGQRIDVAGLNGTKVTGNVDYYGGAIGWTDKMIRFRKVPAMVQLAEIFRNKFFINKANNFYLLLATAAALNPVAWQGVAADGQSRRDILTINECAFQLGNVNRNKGYGDMANAEMIIYANPRDENRIEAAFNIQTNAIVASSENGVSITKTRRLARIYSYNLNIVSGFPLMVLPGRKLQMADAMQPTVYNQEQDALTLNRVQAVWAIYGGIAADTDQVFQFELS